MGNDNQQQVSAWVVEQTTCLNPPVGWQPDHAAALRSFQARKKASQWQAWGAAAAVLLGVILLWPSTRVVAQQLWQLLTVGRVAFIRVGAWPNGVPSPQVNLTGAPIPPLPAHNAEEAGRRVHYLPRLPRAGVLAESPQLYTTFSVSAGMVVRTADLELALRKAGIRDQLVPPQWNGAQVALHTSAVVIAQWPNLVLAQSLPLTLTAPSTFDFPAYSAVILRILGVAPDTARTLADAMGTAPPWLAPLARDLEPGALLEPVHLSAGPATILRETAGAKRVALVWSAPDRVFVLTGSVSRELAIATANAVQ